MTLREYAKSAIWDFLLCVLMSGTLVTALSDGFNIDETLRQNSVLVFGLCALLCALMTATAFSKRTIVPGGIAVAIACCGILAWGALNVTNEHVFADEYGNTLLFATLLIAVCISVFLLSRRPLSSCILAVAGIFAIVLIQFLYQHEPVAQFAIFGIASITNCLFRRYLCNLRASESHKTAFVGAVAVSMVLGLGAAAVGCAVWFCIIAPLNPPAQELILITEYRAQPEVNVAATDTILQLLDDGTSENLTDEELTTNNAEDNENKDDSGSDMVQGAAEAVSSLTTKMYEVLASYWMFILAGIVALIALVIGTRLLLRRRRLAAIRALPPRWQVEAFGQFFIARFAKMGVHKIPTDTPREHLEHARGQIARFDDAVPGESFFNVMDIYERAVFGSCKPSAAELSQVLDYYQLFYKRAVHFVGRIRYMVFFWKL